ncbi:RNA methyltransferase PUA domain-containing protein, partial [Streptococcus pyogenes]
DENQRFFITNEEDIHHIKNVMRNTIGNKIIINFNDKKVFITEITHISSNQIEVLPINQLDIDTELPVDVTICSGLIKADKY